jgi:hypothetical protein
MKIWTIVSVFGGPYSNSTNIVGYVKNKKEAIRISSELNKNSDNLYYYAIETEEITNEVLKVKIEDLVKWFYNF